MMTSSTAPIFDGENRPSISCVQKGLSVREGHEELTPYHKMKEVVLFGLRMSRGVDMKQIKEEFGCFLKDKQREKIDYFIQEGLLIEDDGYLKTSSKGRLVLDELCSQLI